MSDKSAIEWTDATWNPIRARFWEIQDDGSGKERIGWHCEHVSEGCRNCYAEGFNHRLGTGRPFSPDEFKDPAVKPGFRNGSVEVYLDEKTLLLPLRWKRPRKIFVCSMTDVFARFVTDEMLDKIFSVIARCPHHILQILTKRPDRALKYLADDELIYRLADAIGPTAFPLRNVWLGVSVENQKTADERISLLLEIPAVKRFLSCEPLLGPVDLTAIQAPRFAPEDHEIDWKFSCLETGDYYWFDSGNGTTNCGDGPFREARIDWVIAGGESGPNARPMQPMDILSLRDQCAAAGVPFFFKQWGEFEPDGLLFKRVGKKAAGALLDGIEHKAFPDV